MSIHEKNTDLFRCGTAFQPSALHATQKTSVSDVRPITWDEIIVHVDGAARISCTSSETVVTVAIRSEQKVLPEMGDKVNPECEVREGVVLNLGTAEARLLLATLQSAIIASENAATRAAR